MMRLSLFVVVLSVLVAAACCSGEIRSIHVSGDVKFDGAPVPHGRLQFVPEDGGPPGWALITDGKFDTAAEGGRATMGGAHTVVIEGYKEATPAPGDPEATVTVLFEDFEAKADLGTSASEQSFDVPKTAAYVEPKTR